MEAFLGTIITAVLVFYALRFLMKLIGPWIMKSFLKKFMGVNFENTSAEEKQGRQEDDSLTVKTDDGIVLRPRVHRGERVSDRLGHDYADAEVVSE